MKKILVLLMALALVFSLAACGKSEAAQKTEELINAIGNVTLDSELSIVTAETAFEALSDKEKEEVENHTTLAAARKIFDKLVADKKAEEDRIAAEQKAEEERIAAVKAAAAEIDAAINAIGEVSVNSGEAITAARSAYDAADKETQGYVTTLATLEAAEEAFIQAQADEVIALIDAIGKVTLNSEEAINTAKTALKGLDTEAAAKVTNKDVLEAAEATLKDLKSAEAQKLLKGMTVDKDEVRNMAFYYPKNFPYYKSAGYWAADQRCFVLPYLGMQGDDVWLRLVCNYTSSSWVFFEKITYSVDGKNYYDFFSYWDVTRDNGGGDVWEYVDQDVGASEIELLWAIANSTKTIIRFEGDDYYRDFTVSAKDKEAIKQILTVYAALGGK